MNVQVLTKPETHLKGISRPFTGEAANRFEQEHIMWSDQYEAVWKKVSDSAPGLWYAVWNHGIYSITKSAGEVENDELETVVVPAGTYAVFTSECGGFAGEELPKLREYAFSSWLSESGYSQTGDFEVEVYHLFAREERAKRQYELWIPVKKAEE